MAKGIIGATDKATASTGGAQGGALARHKKTGRIKMTPDLLSRIDSASPRIVRPVQQQADHLPRLEAVEDELPVIEADIAKFKTENDDDHADIRAEIQGDVDDLQTQIDALQAGGSTDIADLQDKLDHVVTGLLHEEPVDSICTDPPTKPREDAYYLVSAVPPPTGAFVGHDNQIAVWDKTSKTWTFTTPEDGETRLVEASNKVYTWNGTKWVAIGSVAVTVKTHDLTDKAPLAGGDEFAIVDVADAWAAKKVSIANLRADISKYAAEDAQNLLNKGFDLSKNSVRGTIEDFNAALTDGYEFAIKDDIADLISAEDAKAYADDCDVQVVADLTENLENSINTLHTAITQEIEDAIDAIPDAPVVDVDAIRQDALTYVQEARDDIDDAFDVQKKYIDDQDTKALRAFQIRYSKLSDAVAVGDDKLQTQLSALTDDLNNNYQTSDENDAAVMALQDYLVSLLARHAAQGDSTELAPIKQALEDIFTVNVGDNEKNPKSITKLGRGGRKSTPVKPKPVLKSWVVAPNDNVGYGPNGAMLNPPLTFPSSPLKGCLVLSIENVVSGDGQPSLYLLVYDGSIWQEIDSTSWSMAASNQPPTFDWWCADRSYVDGDTFDPSSGSATAWAWAEADGIHILWNGVGSSTTPGETKFPYPAGVTQADMPASKKF